MKNIINLDFLGHVNTYTTIYVFVFVSFSVCAHYYESLCVGRTESNSQPAKEEEEEKK